jgi:Icc-related predicted phosphoesterase
MKILCSSDWHGHLPPSLPECDLLLLAGDIEPNYKTSSVGSTQGKLQYEWLVGRFLDYLKSQPVGYTFVIPGNHTFIDKSIGDIYSSRFHYYQDTNYYKWKGIKFGFQPYSLEIEGWAWGKNEAGLKKVFDEIPEVDIMLTHAPGKYLGDINNWGSYALLHYIEEKKPKRVVCGHIHEAFGQYTYGDSVLHNVSYLDGNYQPKNPPVMLEMETSFKCLTL